MLIQSVPTYKEQSFTLLIMIQYLQETRDNTLALKINYITMADWCDDSGFAVHADMKRHTGGVLTMGKGEIKMISLKQKINTKLSIGEQLVALNDVL